MKVNLLLQLYSANESSSSVEVRLLIILTLRPMITPLNCIRTYQKNAFSAINSLNKYHHRNVYRCTVHFEIYVVHSPTNAVHINFVKSFKFTLKSTIISLLHASVFNDHHQRALSVPNWSNIYVKTLGKITSLYKLDDVAAFCHIT